MGVLIGTMSLGQAMPNLEFISTARGAAAAVWEIIDLVISTLGVIFHLHASLAIFRMVSI